MDPSDSSQNRRKIPAVSDVVAELSKRLLASPEQQPVLFRAAQQVCAEELRLVRTGFRSAPFDELVERAIRLLPAEMAREQPPRATESSAYPEPDPFDTIAAPRSDKRVEDGPFTLDSGEALESYEPPTRPPNPVSDPVRPLEISEKTPPPATPAPPHRGYLREPGKDRHSASTSVTRVFIFLLLVGLGFGAYRLARSGYWPFRKTASPAPKSGTAPPPPAAAPKPAASETTGPRVLAPSSSSARTAVPAAPPRPAAREVPIPRPTSANAASPKPAAVPNSSRATGSTPGAASSPAPAPNATTAPTEGVPESRGSSMISADWSGHAPAFMVHFSSYQKRENAERDRARLSKELGRPFRIIEVNLGREGSWFRVMLGEFASRDEALAFRQQLADKGTQGLGLVYRVSGTR